MTAPLKYIFWKWPKHKIWLTVRSVGRGLTPGKTILRELREARYEYFADKLADARSEDMINKIGHAASDKLYIEVTKELAKMLMG